MTTNNPEGVYREYKAKITCPFCGWSREIALTKHEQQYRKDICKKCGLGYVFSRIGWNIQVTWDKCFGISDKALHQLMQIGEKKREQTGK